MKRIGRILLCILMITVLFGISIMGNFVVKSENKSKEKKRTAITKEEMKEWAAPDEETLKYYDLGKFSTTLPVIYMNTKGQQILKENVICGNIALLDGNEEAQSVSAVPNSIYRATIKYRVCLFSFSIQQSNISTDYIFLQDLLALLYSYRLPEV